MMHLVISKALLYVVSLTRICGMYSFSGGDGSSKGAGFYMDQYSTMPVTMSELGLSLGSSISGSHGNTDSLQAGMVSPSAAAQQGMYESVMNFALKPEKGMPPTPPGKIFSLLTSKCQTKLLQMKISFLLFLNYFSWGNKA